MTTRIVAVDDDEGVLAFLNDVLTRASYDVTTFTTAKQALEHLAKHEPELIISDVVMPETGGFAFKQAYQQSFPSRRTPFVFLSSMSDESTVVRGLDAGADDYIVKPAAAEVLLAKIRAVLRRTEKADATPMFQGDLNKYPFVKVLQFCEVKGLTGDVEIKSAGVSASVHFSPAQSRITQRRRMMFLINCSA